MENGDGTRFYLAIEFYQLRVIEYTKSPIEITMTKTRAAHPDYADPRPATQRPCFDGIELGLWIETVRN